MTAAALTPTPAPTPAAPVAPTVATTSGDDVIHALGAVQLEQAQKIANQCLA